jgi:uncharacterized membrane protein YeaQ/YmgE (transglycosylase-associated protein family)
VHWLWTILIGVAAGLADRMVAPHGGRALVVGIALGIVGSLAAALIGQALGLYRPEQSAGFIGCVIGAVSVLLAYHLITAEV